MGTIGVKSHYEGIRHGSAVELYFFPGGYLGLSPVEGGRTNVAALLSPDAFHRAGKTVEKAIAMAARCNSALRRRLEGGRPVPGTQKAVAPVTLSRKPVAWDVIPHIGDAAAIVPPLCGDGMAMALRSVELCVPWADRFLRGDITLDVWRSQYSRSLRKQFSGPLWWGNLLQYAMVKPLLASTLLRFGWFTPGLAARLVKATRLKG
jgi:flavin-dependent dehydrogenase